MTSPLRPSIHEYASWALALLAMLTIIEMHLLPSLIAGLVATPICHAWLKDRLVSRRRI